MQESYPRDLVGYANEPPHAGWPGDARLAVSFVLNYEEGGERSVLHGDESSETFLSEIIGADARSARHMAMESLYEYGSRVGVWRVLELFESRDMPLTIFAVGMAAARHPDVIKQMVSLGHEICSHGYRWIDYQYVPEDAERDHIRLAIEAITKTAGERPLGWYTGRTSPNTRRLVVEEGGFLYDSDDYSDDLPFWTLVDGTPHLVIPYALDTNDMRFVSAQGFHTGEQFYTYLKDAFDVLRDEGRRTPRLMSVGLHCRLTGRPGRVNGLQRFLDYVKSHDDVWVCRRVDVARHWRKRHPPG